MGTKSSREQPPIQHPVLLDWSKPVNLNDSETLLLLIDHGITLRKDPIVLHYSQCLGNEVYEAVDERLAQGAFTISYGGAASMAPQGL